MNGVDIGRSFGSRFGQGLGFADLVSIILSNAVALAAIIFFFLIFLGGFFIISGAGSGNQEQTAKGKKALTAAVVGFFVVFTSYWIIKIIEQVFGQIKILEPNL